MEIIDCCAYMQLFKKICRHGGKLTKFVAVSSYNRGRK
ncbi:hypothetical protein QSI_4650 [Clostridioides difficile P28]|nr:hypothetical protein QSI_4650 [Clostridioides difficile P28]